MRTTRLTAALVALLLTACGGTSTTPSAPPDDSTPATSAAPASVGGEPAASTEPDAGGTRGGGSCHVDVTGDTSLSWDGSGGSSAVGTDYWYTRQELEDAAEVFGGEVTEGEPVFFILILNCVASGGGPSISLIPSSASTFDDVPFAPRDYPIAAAGALGGGAAAGEFTTIFTLGTDQVFEVSEPGAMSVTKFDTSGIAGTFSFSANEILVETPATIEVSGSFDFGCTGQSACTP